MSILSQLAGMFSRSTREENQLLEAIEHAHAGRASEAMEIYNDLLNRPSTSSELRAKVLYNRALVHPSNKEDDKALADLKAVLATPNLPENIQSAARTRLARVKKRSE